MEFSEFAGAVLSADLRFLIFSRCGGFDDDDDVDGAQTQSTPVTK